MKKIVFAVLIISIICSLCACSSVEDKTESGKISKADTVTDNANKDETGDSTKQDEDLQKDLKGELVVWTLAEDLTKFSDYFMSKYPNVNVKTEVIIPDEYIQKVSTAILGNNSKPDIIVAEPQMLESMMEEGYFEDLNQDVYKAQDYKDKVVDYVWEAGQDSEGKQRAISYQVTPSGVYYRRDIAKEVFGFDTPEEVGKLFKDYNTILETGETLKEAGYRIFASDSEMSYCAYDEPWVVDGKLNMEQSRYDFMNVCSKLYTEDLTINASQWCQTWFDAMSGEVPIIPKDVNVWDQDAVVAATKDSKKTQVFSYVLPSWGVITMGDYYKNTSGNWGICACPSYGFGGGTFIGINAISKNKELAWEYLKFVTLTEDTMEWWIEESGGDTVAYLPVLNKHLEDENKIYGGEQIYKFWLEQAQGIDYSKVTKYDDDIKILWTAAISSVKTGELNQEEAIEKFKKDVTDKFPDILLE